MLNLALTLFALAAAPQDGYAPLAAAKQRVSKPALVTPYGSLPRQHGELRVPRGRGPFPVAMLIHGGCWRADMEDASGTAPLADALAARGIASWNISYRRLGDAGGGYPGTLQDVAAALDHLAVLAESQPLDLSHVAVIGHSSGAHLALWAASRHRLDTPIAGTRTVRPETVVAIDGPGSLAPMIGADAQVCGQPAIVPFMGGTPAQKPEAYRLASPVEHLPFGVHQILILGSLAPLMQPYADAAIRAGDTVVKLAPGGADHFNIITPATPEGKQVADFIAVHAFAR